MEVYLIRIGIATLEEGSPLIRSWLLGNELLGGQVAVTGRKGHRQGGGGVDRRSSSSSSSSSSRDSRGSGSPGSRGLKRRRDLSRSPLCSSRPPRTNASTLRCGSRSSEA